MGMGKLYSNGGPGRVRLRGWTEAFILFGQEIEPYRWVPKNLILGGRRGGIRQAFRGKGNQRVLAVLFVIRFGKTFWSFVKMESPYEIK